MGPMIVICDRKATLQAIHTTNSQEKDAVLDDCPFPINNTEKDLTKKGTTLAQLRTGYCGNLCFYKSRGRRMLVSTYTLIGAMHHMTSSLSSFNRHIDIVRIRNLLTFDASAQLIHALITTHLDFCNRVLYNIPNNKIERLQWIQNLAARILKRIPRRNHITPVLKELHWPKINGIIIFKF